MQKLKKILFNPWTVGIGTPVIAAFVLKLIERLSGLQIFKYLFGCVVLVGQNTLYWLSLKTPFWVLLVILIVIGMVYLVISQYVLNRRIFKPAFLKYRKGIFEGILYKWEYDCISKIYGIGRIIAYCPACDCRVVYLQCQACKLFYFDRKDRKQLEAMIRHSIQKKYKIDEFSQIKSE